MVNVDTNLFGPHHPKLAHLHHFDGQIKGVLIKSVLELEDKDITTHLAPLLIKEYADIFEEGLLPNVWYPELFFCSILLGLRQLTSPRQPKDIMEDAKIIFHSMANKYHKLFCRIVGALRVDGLSITQKAR